MMMAIIELIFFIFAVVVAGNALYKLRRRVEKLENDLYLSAYVVRSNEGEKC
jgi:hypothetical protein